MTDITPQPAPATTPAPGWYDDGSGRQRWYDGTAWTDHYQAAPVQVAVPVQTDVRKARDKAVYTREQKGHSIVFWILLGGFVLWIPAIYYSVSPNHYWHT